jgi:hypothetical protein
MQPESSLPYSLHLFTFTLSWATCLSEISGFHGGEYTEDCLLWYAPRFVEIDERLRDA